MIGRPLFLISALIVAAGSCARNQSITALDAISLIRRSTEAAFAKGDAEAIAKVYMDDAEWYIPESPVIKGRSAIRQAWKANTGLGGNRLRIEVAEVEQRGDRAHEVGRFTISASDGAVVSAGKYIVIWTRQPDGEWKTYRDIFNWDIPPRQP